MHFVHVMKNYTGSICGERCVDIDCKISCNCNSTCSGNGNNCSNNIIISNSSYSLLLQQFSIQGNVTIEGSNVSLTSIEITASNLSISDSNVYFSSSTIISKGCINLYNTKITVDLSKSNTSQILLLNSTSGCLIYSSTSISYINKPKCSDPSKEEDSYSLIILVNQQPNCGQVPIEAWIIALIVVIGLVIITISIILLVPSIRRKIFAQKKLEI